jgi:hypothetical protein
LNLGVIRKINDFNKSAPNPHGDSRGDIRTILRALPKKDEAGLNLVSAPHDTMASDPRVSKPRLPKAYTDEQLIFLRSHISGFETRTRGHVRGDAKKFALDRANEFLVLFGMPEDLQDTDEAEVRFREVRAAVVDVNSWGENICVNPSKYTIGTRIPWAEQDESSREEPDPRRLLRKVWIGFKSVSTPLIARSLF